MKAEWRRGELLQEIHLFRFLSSNSNENCDVQFSEVSITLALIAMENGVAEKMEEAGLVCRTGDPQVKYKVHVIHVLT